MDVIRVHQILSYLVSLCGATCLYFAEQSEVPPYPILAVVLAVFAHEMCDRRRRFFMPKILSDLLTIGLVVAIFVKFSGITLTFLTDLGRLLIGMQVIRWFRPKTVGDYWSLYALSLLQVGISCTVNKTQVFGALVVLYVALAMLAMTMFVIRQHGAAQSFGATRNTMRMPPLILRGLTWGRLGTLMFLLFVASSVVAAPIFMLVPRVQVDVGEISVRGDTSGITTIGYKDEVVLDQNSNTVVNNEDLVLEVKVSDSDGKPATLPAELLWRGAVFTDYAGPNWVPSNGFANAKTMPDTRILRDNEIEMQVERKTRLRDMAFCPLGLEWIKYDSPNGKIDFYPWYQVVRINRTSSERRRLEYTMHVDKDFGNKRFKNPNPHSREYIIRVTTVSSALTRLPKLVAELMKDIPQKETQKRIDRLMTYLMTSEGELSYMMNHEPGEPGVDPIEDFLFRRKRGNCEYFASSLALMLRSAGIPSRLVNGFKGADVSESGKTYQVRQLHAHSWVEAYFEDTNEWVTLDPTPGDARNQQLEAARSSTNFLQKAYDQISSWWFRNVMNYGQSDQQADLSSIAEAMSNFFGMTVTEVTQLAKDTPALIVSSHFWSSGRGFAWAFALAISVTMVFTMKHWMAAIRLFIMRFWRRRSLNDFPLYDRWLLLLERLHIDRQKHETPLELATRISHSWQTAEPAALFADLPEKLVGSYYSVRFGREKPDQELLTDLTNRLEHLHLNHRIYFPLNGHTLSKPPRS